MMALHRHLKASGNILPPKSVFTSQDVGGMNAQKQAIREAVEPPLAHFDLYKKVGIDPPLGVLL
jgi:26S proteasome regulatory subunit T3